MIFLSKTLHRTTNTILRYNNNVAPVYKNVNNLLQLAQRLCSTIIECYMSPGLIKRYYGIDVTVLSFSTPHFIPFHIFSVFITQSGNPFAETMSNAGRGGGKE